MHLTFSDLAQAQVVKYGY